MPEEITHVALSNLRVAATNTRKDTSAGQEDVSLQGLAQSIKEHGLLSPLVVRPAGNGTYEILAGQRRYLACRELRWPTVPVIVRSKVSETTAVTLSVIENVQRADMHPLDKAKAFTELKDRHQGNLRTVSDTTGIKVPTIQKYFDLLNLPPELQSEVGTGKGSAGVGAMATLARTFEDPDDMVEAFNQIGAYTEKIQAEILKRSDGDVTLIPGLVTQAAEGAFDIKPCGSGIADCPHIPDELRAPLAKAVRALEEGQASADQPLKEVAASHKKPKRTPSRS